MQAFLFIAFIGVLYFALCIFPQGLWGMLIAYRTKGPMHTDETGFPTNI